MPSDFDLVITADYPSHTAELRLLDEGGSQLAFQQTDFKAIAVSRQQGLFDLRNYLRLYAEPGQEAADADFTGSERLERLSRNLVRALRDEPILLVLDNFETNLKPRAEASTGPGEPVWACQDPAWDRCLAALATELASTGSRVLITCRRPLAALDSVTSHSVLLGPLPAGEAALYLRSHAELSKLTFSDDGGEKALALRLLTASRFHPLLMNRLARLATGGPDLRPQLMAALEALEKSTDHARLPALFAADAGDKKELAYLSDALATSLDGLIESASPQARRLLWMIAIANEPITLGLLQGVWSGESQEQDQLRQMKQMLDMLPELPPELQEKLKAMPPNFRAMLDALPPEAPARPELAPLLSHLVAVGLVTEERTALDDANPDLTCHELVRERIRAWMEERPQDQAELTENAIRLAYAERLEATFKALMHQNMTTALQAGSRALVYCVQAEAWDRLGGFASEVVTSAADPRLLAGLLPHLEAATDAAPEGEPRHAEILARAFISALDIARQAHFARRDWESALAPIDATLEVERALERPGENVAATRMNRANVLVELPGRFGEAKAEMEACLQIFENNPASRAKVLSSLAALFGKQGDVGQAIDQERRALAVREQLPDPADRAISHNNLANYLERRGTAPDLTESPATSWPRCSTAWSPGWASNFKTPCTTTPPTSAAPNLKASRWPSPRRRAARRPGLPPAGRLAPTAPGRRGRGPGRGGSSPRASPAGRGRVSEAHRTTRHARPRSRLMPRRGVS